MSDNGFHPPTGKNSLPLARSTWYFHGAGELRLVRRGPGGRMRQIRVGEAALILARPRTLLEEREAADGDRPAAGPRLEEAP